MTKCRGDKISATKDVENNISMIATFPSSLLNIFENGSVWYIRNPLEVPGSGSQVRTEQTSFASKQLTDRQTAIILVKSHKIHSHPEESECKSFAAQRSVEYCAQALSPGRCAMQKAIVRATRRR